MPDPTPHPQSDDATFRSTLRDVHSPQPLTSTLGELRQLVAIADGIDAPDECDVYVTVHADGATRHGSRLRNITIVAPGPQT